MVTIKEDAEPFETANFWYDVLEGGYLVLPKYVDSVAASNNIKEAIGILQSFKIDMEKAGMIYDL